MIPVLYKVLLTTFTTKKLVSDISIQNEHMEMIYYV